MLSILDYETSLCNHLLHHNLFLITGKCSIEFRTTSCSPVSTQAHRPRQHGDMGELILLNNILYCKLLATKRLVEMAELVSGARLRFWSERAWVQIPLSTLYIYIFLKSCLLNVFFF